jgi:alpha-glucosidase (family GH31 glycosyl hydrolase)
MPSQINFLTPSLVRLRCFTGETPPEQPLIRYGFFRDDFPPVPVETDETDAAVTVRSDVLTVTRQKTDGSVVITDASGQELLRSAEPPLVEEGLTEARFVLPPERLFFGLGDQQRERLELRGTQGDLWVRNVTGYIPIPFFWSPDGFGLLVNTTRRVIVDLGRTSADWFGFRQPEGCLDYYFIHGPSPTEIIERYTDLTGRPPMPPKWALGLWFVCRTQANDREFMEDCLHFRDRHIPCDAISLEPGWMEKNYDFSITKDWSKERFPVPSYDRNPGRYTFLRAARRMGFKPGLWLCQDYDLSYEAERRAQATVKAAADKVEKRGFEQDEHLAAARRMDQLTKPEVPWFEHLKDFVDQGAEWFKQDGSNQVLEHPDRLYGNGMRDDEMHNLYPMLYSKQMYEGFAEHTGRRPFGFTCSGWAGLQRWTGTWTGDTGGEERPLVACLNLALSGHGMNTVDMEVTTKEGIHFGFLLPWAQLCSWNYFRHPWYQGARLERIFKDYAELRYRLIPYLYTTARQAHQTGLPIMRPMPLMWPDDPETHQCLRQFMLGDSLLAACFTDEVYLPEGEWYDYWTQEKHTGGRWLKVELEADKGGPLFVRAGAVIPCHGGLGTRYVGDSFDDKLEFAIWPTERGEAVAYEDDNLSLEYERGAGRTTRCSYELRDGKLTATIHAAEGDFAGCEDRQLSLTVHGLGGPREVTVNGAPVQVLRGGDDEPDDWAGDAAPYADVHEPAPAVTVVLGTRSVSEAVTVELAY